MTAQATTQAVYVATFALAMIGAGLAKRQLVWKRRKRRWTRRRHFRRTSLR